MRSIVQGEEKLAAVRSRRVLVRHRYLTPVIEFDAGVDLVSKRLAVNALAPASSAGRIPALDHELSDDPVENRVVVILSDIELCECK